MGNDDLAVLRTYERLATEAESAGYHLNPDVEFAKELVHGLLINENRYGYWNCPCRLATGNIEQDRDVICPCDYRDQDLMEFGSCYCALYVNDAIAKKEQIAQSIPERRSPLRENQRNESEDARKTNWKYPVWRCRVCGYLCARNGPPETCPICRAKKDRFERFLSYGERNKSMKLSARNVWKGTIKNIQHGAVNSEIIVELPGGLEVVSVITKSSAHRLELEIGKETYVIVKATSILLAVD